MRIFKHFYYLIEIFILLFLKKSNNFLIVTPRIISLIINKVLIFNIKNKKFFNQNVRNSYDINTVFQIFGYEEYNLNNFIGRYKMYTKYYNSKKKLLIIDCGSNIGSSTRYFNEIFKKSKIIAIEPEKNNFSFSKLNVSTNDVKLINSAVSSSKKNFEIRKNNDPRAHTVNYLNRPKNNKHNKKTFLIDQIVNQYKNYLPFIIKIDIEGAESDLFKKNIKWLNDFKIIIIELHDWMMPNKSISSSFIKSLSSTLKKTRRDLIIQGENLISIKINK